MATATSALQAKLGRSPGMTGIIGFGIVLLVGVVYRAFHLLADLSTVRSGSVTRLCCWRSPCLWLWDLSL